MPGDRYKPNPFTGNLDNVGPTFGVGSTISGGTAGSVLFINPANTLAQDNANFFYDDTLNGLFLGSTSSGFADNGVLNLNGNLYFKSGSATTRLITSSTLTNDDNQDSIKIVGGANPGSGTGDGGSVYVAGGNSTNGTSGSVYIYGGTGTTEGSKNVYLAYTDSAVQGSVLVAGANVNGRMSVYSGADATIGLYVAGTVSQSADVARFVVSASLAGVTSVLRYYTTINGFHAYSSSLGSGGSASAPAFQISGLGVGMYASAANTLGISTNSTEAISISSAQIVTFLAGSATAPTVAFVGATTSGLYSPGSNQIGIAVNGVSLLAASSSEQIGLNNTAGTSAAVYTSTMTTTASARGKWMAVNYTFNPTFATAPAAIVLDFTVINNKTIVTRCAQFTPTIGANNSTSNNVGVRSVPSITATATITSGSRDYIAYEVAYGNGTAANYTGGSLNFVGLDLPTSPTSYSGSGLSVNYYPIRINDATGTVSSGIHWTDAVIYRRAANILALASGDSLEVPANFAVGTTIDTTTSVTANNTSATSGVTGVNSVITMTSSTASDRSWGLRFQATQAGSTNYSSSLGTTGFEGLAINSGSGTSEGIMGGAVYARNSGSGTLVRATGLLILANENTGAGSVTNSRELDIGIGPTITANNQTRIGLRLGIAPDPGSFTGTTSCVIQINSATTGLRSSILWGTSASSTSNIYLSASNTLKTDGSWVVGTNLTANTGTSTFSTLAGALDAGGATSFEVPNGAGGTTVDATGEICVDSTSRTVNFYDGTAEVVLDPLTEHAFFLEAPTATDDFPVLRVDKAMTLVKTVYAITGGTNWVGQLQEADDAQGTGAADTQAADSTVTGTTTVTSYSNASFDAGDYIRLKTTSVSGVVTWLHVTFYFRINP